MALLQMPILRLLFFKCHNGKIGQFLGHLEISDYTCKDIKIHDTLNLLLITDVS